MEELLIKSEKDKKKPHLKVEQMVAGGFGIVILIGALLLMLPISRAPGMTTHFSDALFTAVSAVCVTGLVTVTTATQWSLFGQVVIICLVQLGGLGIVACMTLALILTGRRISMNTRKVIASTYNLDTLSGVLAIIKRIIFGTLIVEGVGVIPYAIVFVPEFGPGAGIFKAVFNSISCFCNAGMDVLGTDSLAKYLTNPIININTMLLIILGSIGFFVWFDVIDTGKKRLKGEKRGKSFFGSLKLHTRLAIVSTLFLIIGGTVLIALFDWNNQNSLGPLSAPQKIMAAAFQSITTRTAGYQTIPQQNFTDASCFVSLILMFIGGSPMGTAGGMKTTTVAIVVLTTVAYLKGKEHTELYNRKLRESDIRTALVVLCLGISIALAGVISLSAVTGAGTMDVLFEVFSAVGTVGLTRGMTPDLNLAGKIIIMIIMYCGRLGPITLAMAVTARQNAAKKLIRYPEEKIMIG